MSNTPSEGMLAAGGRALVEQTTITFLPGTDFNEIAGTIYRAMEETRQKEHDELNSPAIDAVQVKD